MKTAVPPSYLDAQTIKFREICIIWWPTSIENFTFCKNEFLAQINMLLGFVDQIFKNLLVFVVIYTFRPDLVTTESLLNKRNSELQLNRRQRSLGQWLRPMSLRAPLEYSKDWLWSLCKWNENERSFSFSSKRDTSFPGHKPPYFVEITVFFNEFGVDFRRLSCIGTIQKQFFYCEKCIVQHSLLIEFSQNWEKHTNGKVEISLLGGPAIMILKSWKRANPFNIWSEIWRTMCFWTFLVDPENRAEHCQKI